MSLNNFTPTAKDLSKGSIKELRSGHRSKILSVAWNASGSRFASGGYDQLSKVFSLGDCHSSNLRDAVAVDLKGHSADVDQVRWHPSDDNILVTTGSDKTLRLWDVRAPTSAKVVINTVGENINIDWSPDGNTIAVGNKDDEISFIDPRGGSGGSDTSKHLWHTIKREYEINEIRWDYTGNLFYMTTGHGTVQVLDFPSFKPAYTVNAHTSNCYCLEFDPMGRMPVRAMSFSFCGELLACAGSDDKFIEIASVETGESLHNLQVGSSVDTLAWHPSKYILAYSGEDVSGKSRGGHGSDIIGIFTLH
ncbi:THO complex subunit 3 [Podochytrium sp. JEL0797]|nr:THO complex subunit 3 [Podochytrium sp. JEL0797]